MDADLRAYKELYLSTANELVLGMQEIIVQLAAQPTPLAVEALFIKSHSLKGQSMTMGYTGIAKTSLAIERYMRVHKEEGTLPDKQAVSVIADALPQLASSLVNISKSDRELPMSSLITTLEQRLGIKV